MLLSNLNLLATAPGGVARLRELILTLAVQGKLVPQDAADEPASVLLEKIAAEKERLVAEGKIKRGKPLGGISAEEKPFELPVGWEWVRLNSLLQKIGAGSTPLGGREVYVPSGVKFLRSQNVWDDGLRLESVAFIKPETHAKMAGTVVVANDLLFNITGASIGRCAVVPSNFDEANVSQHVSIVRPVFPALNAYLHKVLVSRHVQQAVMDVQVGVSREGLSIAKLGHFLIPVPPLHEQSRIVTRVEELMQLCDALEAKGRLEAMQHARLVSTLLATLAGSPNAEALAENWQRVSTHFDLLLDRPEAVDALEQTLLQLAVRGLLTSRALTESDGVGLDNTAVVKGRPLVTLPEFWRWVRLGDVVELINGDRGQNYPNKAEYVLVGVPFINTGHIDPDGSLSSARMNFLTREKFNSLRSGKVKKGDLVYCLRGATLGKTAIVDYDEGAIASSLVIVRPSAEMDSRFMYLFLTSPLGRSFIQQHDNGSAQPNLAAGSLKKYWIPLPPLPEQARIVARVASLRRLSADLRQRLAARQSVQTQLAEALVHSQSTPQSTESVPHVEL